jgi:hypothetical protein
MMKPEMENPVRRSLSVSFIRPLLLCFRRFTLITPQAVECISEALDWPLNCSRILFII